MLGRQTGTLQKSAVPEVEPNMSNTDTSGTHQYTCDIPGGVLASCFSLPSSLACVLLPLVSLGRKHVIREEEETQDPVSQGR